MLDSFAKIHFWCPTVGQRDRICTEHRKMSCSTLRLKGQCKNISLKIINYYSLGNLLLSLFSWTLAFSSVQFSSVALLCPTLCDPMNCSTLGLPIHHQLPESTQTHVHCVGDAIQPFHPLSSHSPPALNPSQHQGLLKWVSLLHQVAKVLEFQLQHPMNTPDWSPLEWIGWIFSQSKGLWRVFSNTTVQKHQFFRAQLPL